MNSPGSRGVYEARMHRVLEHIERHLHEPLDLAVLAGVANFSPFHFHRLFAAWMGERLGDHVRRRRLEVAAVRLIAQPHSPVLDIALAVGFGSAEAFARAFKLRFGSAPTAWRVLRAEERRQLRNPGQADGNPDQADPRRSRDDAASTSPHEKTSMNVRLIDRPEVAIAYLRHVGPYGAAVGRFWSTTFSPWLAANGLLGAPRYGISHDDPSITDPAQCRYDACVEVAPTAVLAGKALRTSIPGGRYAVLDFTGTAMQIGEAWTAMLRDWLTGSGLQIDNRPCFEHYPAGSTVDAATGVFTCEICIAVTPL